MHTAAPFACPHFGQAERRTHMGQLAQLMHTSIDLFIELYHTAWPSATVFFLFCTKFFVIFLYNSHSWPRQSGACRRRRYAACRYAKRIPPRGALGHRPQIQQKYLRMQVLLVEAILQVFGRFTYSSDHLAVDEDQKARCSLAEHLFPIRDDLLLTDHRCEGGDLGPLPLPGAVTAPPYVRSRARHRICPWRANAWRF